MFSIKFKKDYNRIIENIFSLSLINGINYIFPLIIIPFLTIKIGIENYGRYSLAYSIIVYLNIIVTYGFDLSATKKISINRNDINIISMIFNNVIFSRLILSLLCTFLLLIIYLVIPKFHSDFLLYFSGVGFFIGTAITPLWLFQGLEKMKYLTLINFISRFSSLILIFLFIKNQNDYININLLFSIGFIISGVFSLILAVRTIRIKIQIPSYIEIITELKEGWQIFLSMIYMNLYRNSNIIILGFLADFNYVGIYSASEKIIKAFQSITTPIVNALYPYFSRTLNTTYKGNSIKVYYKVIKYYSVVLFLIVLFILLFSEYIIDIYLPDSFSNSAINVKLMSPIILFGGLSFFIGINGLINLGYEKVFSRAVLIAGILNITICFLLVYLFKDLGASISMLITEFTLFLGLYILFIKYVGNNQLEHE